jgi:hypothetical protein
MFFLPMAKDYVFMEKSSDCVKQGLSPPQGMFIGSGKVGRTGVRMQPFGGHEKLRHIELWRKRMCLRVNPSTV